MHTLFLPVDAVRAFVAVNTLFLPVFAAKELISKEITNKRAMVSTVVPISQEIISIAALIRRLHYVLHELLHS